MPEFMMPVEDLSREELREIAADFMRKFNSLCKQALFYPEEHPILQEAINEFRRFLKTFLENYGRFLINFFEGQIFLYNIFVPQAATSFEKTISDLEEKGIKEITFLPGTSKKEIYNFARLVNEKKEVIESTGGIQAALVNNNITHIIVVEAAPSERDSGKEHLEGDSSISELSFETYNMAIQAIKEIANDLLTGRPIIVTQARRVVDSMVEKVLQNPDALLRLSILKNYDEDTFYHSVNVLILSITLGAFIKLEKIDLTNLGMSALLHDIGKIKIPVDIIRKPTSLTPGEWEIIKSHPVMGAEALLTAKGLNKISIAVALEHHMGYDKRGYPQINLIDRPHLFSRMVETVDIYDALTSQRAYRKPTLPDNALRLIYSQGGKKLDPLLSSAFVKLMGIYPVGSTVKLNTGEYAIVVKPGKEDITRPKVLVILDSELKAIDPLQTVDLLKEARLGGKRTTILESIHPLLIGINPEDYVVYTDAQH